MRPFKYPVVILLLTGYYFFAFEIDKIINFSLEYLQMQYKGKPHYVLNFHHKHIAYGFLAAGLFCLFFMKGVLPKPKDIVMRIKNMYWDVNDFCRGWLIVGKTGSGKTASGFATMIHQLFENVRPLSEKERFKGKNWLIPSTVCFVGISLCLLPFFLPDGSLRFHFYVIFGVLMIIWSLIDFRTPVLAKMKEWGGIAIDFKGNFWAVIYDIALFHGAADRLVVLQVRPANAPIDWKPKFQYNLLSYPGIPPSTYALLIVSTGDSIGGDNKGDKFWSDQAMIQITNCFPLLEVCRSVKKNKELVEILTQKLNSKTHIRALEKMPHFISLENMYTLLCNISYMTEVISVLETIQENPVFKKFLTEEELKKLQISCEYFNSTQFLKMSEDTLKSVVSSIQNYLAPFTHPDLAEVFCCEENTVDFEEVDNGKIFTVAMPQKFKKERIYVNTFMKLIYYTHIEQRFDDRDTIKQKNLLVMLADEAQGVITTAAGNSDFDIMAIAREARATGVFASQSTTSFLPVYNNKNKVEALLLNLSNILCFQAKDEPCAKLIADNIGKHEIYERSYSYGKGGRTVSKRKKEEYRIKPYQLMDMKKFECVLLHCEQGHRKMKLPPLDDKKKIPVWYHNL